MKSRMILIAWAMSIAACTAPSLLRPAPTLTPTSSPTDTPEPTSTLTATPSATPEPTQTATSTLPPLLLPFPVVPAVQPSRTAAPSHDLDCDVLTQSVRNGTAFGPSESFSVGWRISNTGTAGWEPANVVFSYLGGTKMQQTEVVHLPAIISPGDTVILTVDMRAPNKSSEYTTVWGLRRGTEVFCPVSVTISVRPS